MRPVVIRRKRKHEAEQAIQDLEKRGYSVVYPLTELTRDGKIFDRDSYSNRRKFVENVQESCWIAKLIKEDKEMNRLEDLEAITKEELIDFLKHMRKSVGYTQSQFAERLGVNPKQYNNWETGKNMPRDIESLVNSVRAIVKTILKKSKLTNEVK